MHLEAFFRKLLNKLTMYRLMIYFLGLLLVVGLAFNYFEILPYDIPNIIWTASYLFLTCNLANILFARLFGAKANLESATITALILSLVAILYPPFEGIIYLSFLALVSMGSKYIFTYRNHHIFNPAVLALLLSGIFLKEGASWWIESSQIIYLIIVFGMLAVIKAKRVWTLSSFLIFYFIILFLTQGVELDSILVPSIWFFAFVMLIEPRTSPSNKRLQIGFGIFTAIAYFVLREFLPRFGYGLEISLLSANLIFFFMRKPINIVLEFLKKQKIAQSTWALYFKPNKNFDYEPGQYVEITVPHWIPDLRGIRRYFTISASPTEENMFFTTRLPKKHSSFKETMMNLEQGEKIISSGPHGDFVLPKNKSIPLAFVAGGIGVTPFRSIIKYLIDKNEKRDIVLLYSNNTEHDIAFRDLLTEAESVGVKTHYIITEKEGFLNEEKVKEMVPDYKQRVFYVSGPSAMVDSCVNFLGKMKISEIETDYFPGY